MPVPPTIGSPLTTMIAILITAAIIVLILIWAALTYNRLVSMRLRCKSSWAQIDVALRQRHDLIPALTGAVSGYAGHERRTLEEVAEARSAAIALSDAGPARRGGSEGRLGGGLAQTMLLVEDYPELRASERFEALQRDLAAVEERISITRRVYNDTVERYNTATAVFPSVLVARLLRFAPREFFEAPSGVEIAPKISLPTGA